MSGSRTFPSLPIVSLPTRPRTGAEAKRMAEQLNRAAKRRRAERDDAHKTRQRQIAEEARQMRENGKSAGRRVNVAAVYCGRRAGATQAARGGGKAAASVPRRPRSFAEIAHAVYGVPDSPNDMIAASSRGGR